MDLNWFSGSGALHLHLTLDEARKGFHGGDCEPDLVELMRDPTIRGQLEDMDPLAVAQELRETGAYTDADLMDRELNMLRLLWMACADLADEPELYQ